jgi:uncharacterized caspase-like protein
VIVKFRVRSQGETPSSVTAHLDGQVAEIVTLLQAGEVTDTMLVTLAGRVEDPEVVLSLIAEDEHGASDPAEVRLEVVGAGSLGPGRLLVLAVGVSTYANHPGLQLRYAAKDAEDLLLRLAKQEGGLYRSVDTLPLLEDDATRQQVNSGLRWLKHEADRGDVAMVFFSGHGHMQEGKYYFLPHDVDASTQDDLSFTGFDQDRIVEGLREVREKGAKVLVFFDTCHSGNVVGGGEQVASRGLPPDIDRIAAELAAAENGVVVFTSSSGAELSYEGDEWSNGAFTTALLEALAGKADLSRNGFISVSELQHFLPRRVRELTESQQNPTIRVPFETLFEAEVVLVR